MIKSNGEWKVTEKEEKRVMPETNNVVLMTRIDKLDEEKRELIKVTSVFGLKFFDRILTEVAI